MEEMSLAISRYDELVMALMLRCGELETRLAMPPPPPPSPVFRSCRRLHPSLPRAPL
ncbi:hypothetical protein KR038_010131, partial [Drosophila bunnanda]